MALEPGGLVVDRRTGAELEVDEREAMVLRRLASAGALSVRELDAEELNALAPLVTEIVAVKSPPRAWLLASKRMIVDGRTDELRALLRSTGRRVEVPPGRPLAAMRGLFGGTLRAYLHLAIPAQMASAMLAITALNDLAGALAWPILVCLTLAVHEGAHLAATRRLIGSDLGVLWTRIGAAAILRPKASGGVYAA